MIHWAPTVDFETVSALAIGTVFYVFHRVLCSGRDTFMFVLSNARTARAYVHINSISRSSQVASHICAEDYIFSCITDIFECNDFRQ